ncbi:MAG: protein kinase [Pseudomonadota bacterium]
MRQISFGKFTLLRRLAVGGMAELYLARMSEMPGIERMVVVKLIASHFAKDDAFVTMFQDEARIAVNLSHPNIGNFFDVGKVEDTHYLAMEFIHGQDLRTILRKCVKEDRGPLPIDIAVQIGIRVCSALHCAHEALGLDGKPLNIIHRDVSPSNIMVTYDGNVKLVDFGIAKAANRVSLTVPGLIKGKVRYLSPEQAFGKPVDRRCDIYILGTSLWEATIGRHLISGARDIDVFQSILNGQITPPSEIISNYPPKLEQILLKALSSNPDDRYVTAQAFQLDLEQFAQQNSFSLSNIQLSRFVRELFNEEFSKWEAAQKQGKSLLEHVLDGAKDDQDLGLGSVLAGEDDRSTEPAENEISRNERSGKKTILFGDVPDSPPSPVRSKQAESLAIPKSKKITRSGLIPSNTRNRQEQPPITKRDPSTSVKVSSRNPIAITPDGKIAESDLDKSELQRPTVLADMNNSSLCSSNNAANKPTMMDGLAGLSNNQPKESTSTFHNSETDSPTTDDEMKLSPPMTGLRPKTGDWAHQRSAAHVARPGTHPYFKGEGKTFFPIFSAEHTRSNKRKLIMFLCALVVVFVSTTIFLSLFFRNKPSSLSSTVVTTSEATPSFRLTSTPSGASVFDATNGRVLGKTPMIVGHDRRKIELHLEGYLVQSITLHTTEKSRHVILKRQPIKSGVRKSHNIGKLPTTGRNQSFRTNQKPSKQGKEKLNNKDIKDPFH